jgi:tRNA threonylcarbamoyladenosine biosynthesis protein TsaE
LILVYPVFSVEVFMVEVISNSPAETEVLAQRLGTVLTGGETIAYFGGLGMGKTRFTAGLAKGMNIFDDVSSPTFSLVHEYRGDKALYHFDMYRITTFEDLCSTGFFDYLDSNSVLAIEWSENIENALPEDKLIRIEIIRGESDNQRILRMSGDSIYEDSWR